jgi:hypothetical protein
MRKAGGRVGLQSLDDRAVGVFSSRRMAVAVEKMRPDEP